MRPPASQETVFGVIFRSSPRGFVLQAHVLLHLLALGDLFLPEYHYVGGITSNSRTKAGKSTMPSY